MGLYPVDPASGEYVIGSPVLDKATIHLDPKYAIGKTFTVIARHNSPVNIYIQSATLNGELLERNFITHEELAEDEQRAGAGNRPAGKIHADSERKIMLYSLNNNP